LPWLALATPAVLLSGGCGREDTAKAASNEGRQGGRRQRRPARPVSVDLVLADEGSLRPDVEYTGTTQPVSEVLLRSRVEGRIVELTADIGDRVKRGQIIARFDPELLLASLNQARAEAAARQSEVAQAQTLVTDAEARVLQARQDFRQKEADAERYAYLAKEGAWPRQQAEQARTNAQIAKQTIVTAQQQVKNAQRAVEAARARFVAQQAVVRQQQEQLGFTVLRSPIDGIVLEQRTEAGNLTQPGGEVLRIGAFDAVDRRCAGLRT
jgi:multidrug efflux pump subunit AcrA (membrane-fusion protein)